uniref:Molybdopterin biosynthesis protein n=1 Tax=Laurenciella marilzae TaxID=1413812 RepID=A0A1Z1M262_9FLOR|nr:Molybdopterin biosynthesis protein [Laurenciella marilzae]ARW59874.1 Molybdopterin biosynthesis protein [Laurenciella marilzae]
MLNPQTNLIELSSQDYLKYSKQIMIENIGIEGQKRLKKSKILIIGAGGLSCPIMMYLAGSGIGYIGIIDDDKIDISNLNRQILYNELDINKLKVVSAQNQLYKINQNCKVITHKYKLSHSNKIEVIKYYDIIIDTTDNFETRNNINKACYELSKTYIYGAVDNFFGQMSVFNYKDGIQYKDLYYMDMSEYQNCNVNGIMGITTSYLGTLQAIETIKIITGYKQKLNNKIIICNLINTLINHQKIYRQKRYTEIIVTNSNQTIKSYNKKTYQNKQVILIDIRTNKEFMKEHMEKSINIPLKSFRLYKTIKFLKKYENIGSIFIRCSNLNRTLVASSILELHKIQHKL